AGRAPRRIIPRLAGASAQRTRLTCRQYAPGALHQDDSAVHRTQRMVQCQAAGEQRSLMRRMAEWCGEELIWVHARDRLAPAVRSCQQRRESARMAYNETTTRTVEMCGCGAGRAGKWVTSCARMRTVMRISGCASR